uniref:PaREP5ab n=1 Tax=Thermofilum pendens TaxID=2269 RepID=A0A7C4BCB7_THEPE
MNVELLVGFASTIAAIAASAATLGYWLGRKFEEIEKRFEEIDKRFEEIDRKFKEIDKRFEGLERRFEELERRMDEEFARTREEFTELVRALHTHLIEFMAMKGLFTTGERSYLLGESERIIAAYKLRGNPLSSEEAEFLLEVLRELREKPAKEVDLAKLDRALEIADQWFKRDRIYEAMKLWINLYTLRAILLKERGEL